jgi:ethanolamine utilization protein EutQ (cupin superfamily)
MRIEEYFSDPARPEFITFGKLIDKRIRRRCGIGLMDLADQDYSSLFEDWDGSKEMAYEMADDILEEEGLEREDC